MRLPLKLMVVLLGIAGIAGVRAIEQDEPESDPAPAVDQMLDAAKLSLAKAIEIAERQVKGGKTYHAELIADEADRPEYEILLVADGKHVVVDVDGISGKATVQTPGEEEGDAGTALEDLPPPVQATILRFADGGQVEAVGAVYAAQVIEDGEEMILMMTEDGTLIGESDLDEDDDDDLDDNFLARLDGNAADVRSPVNLFLD